MIKKKYLKSEREIILKKIKLKRKKDNKKNNNLEFISSGIYCLNLALTGNIFKGYAKGRVVLIKGDYSTGKTELLLEAIAFAHKIAKKKNQKIKTVINDAEFALDYDFAEKIGTPEIIKRETNDQIISLDKIELVESELVEDFHSHLTTTIENNKDCDLIIYGLDSIDSLSDRTEKTTIEKNLKKIKKEISSDDDIEKLKQGYGAQFAKYMSQLFRDLRGRIKKSNLVLILLGQLRDDLKARYHAKSSSSGGRAKNFFATHMINLTRDQKLYKVKDSKNPYGARVLATVEKNKVYPEGRKITYDIILNPLLGADNIGSLIQFCVENKTIKRTGENKGNYLWEGENYKLEKLIKHIGNNAKDYKKLLDLSQETWDEIEENCKVDRDCKTKWIEEM